MENKVTSLNDIVRASKGTVVELPPFIDGEPFYARIRRPSMLGLVRNGKIPNELLYRANELFVQTTGSFDLSDSDMMSEMFDVLDILMEETFIEPTYKEMKDAGVEFTDEQMMFIFNYSQQGVRALESFRTE